MRFLTGLCLAGFVFTAAEVHAHEVRPAYLGLTEIAGNSYKVVWKQPILNDKRLRLDPVFPAGCNTTEPMLEEVIPGALLRRWQIHCDTDALQQAPMRINGLSSTLTDVWVNVQRMQGKEIAAVLKPSDPELWLNQGQGSGLSSYLKLGIEHLLFGFDHILFIVGLMFFVHGFASLVKTVTAFTIAHSITLAGSTLGLVHLSQQPVEAAIALSILFLAYEASRPNRASSLTARLPWLVAFIFGLLHGFGFAGVLKDIGLPEATAGVALLLFNLGVEIGQILVIAVLLGSLALARALIGTRAPGLPLWVNQTPIYAMGTLASYWFLMRLSPLLGL